MLKKSRVVIETMVDEDTMVESGVVVQTVTPLHDLKRNHYIRLAHAWFQERYEMAIEDFIPVFQEQLAAAELSYDTQEKFDAMNMSIEWATFMAGIDCHVTRTTNGTGPGDWEQTEIPDEWQRPEDFFATDSLSLMRAGVSEIHRLNPGLWGTGMDPEEKKMVKVIKM